ncbi:threonine-phosphate decarboxylase CobD [Azospirillum picis]|uniref:threonine-phosphate decarboxylase n=1 Tax=Azospirillum picis TaxID=488438 RepID=A0ABU0MGJ6_9PROT|nr:threonine-phosphate decarboxylase CobD [Azospirillum picis]MBP2298380.1 cobalamin biosynthetic protein CobC [Azospirillum picis]MDQ0532571.1 cobalamin biosynthetic protein CobC [Azospirillum picis]
MARGTDAAPDAARQTPLHGGDLGAARAAFPHAPEPWLDLSTGINPWSYPLPPLSADAWTRLPGQDAEAALLASAGDCYRAPSPGVMAAAPGSQALIQILPRLRPPGRVAVLGPTYAEHARCWTLAGHEVVMVDGIGTDDGPGDADVVVVVNPNNPDGRTLAPSRLLALADSLAARGGWLVVDEAFADMRPEDSLASVAGRPGLVVLRSFGKFFGLAGLRLGIALAPRAVAAALREAVGPWAVSGPGLTIAAAALADRSWILAMRSRLSQAAADLDRLLEAAGLRVVGGTDLFRLVEDPRAPMIFRQLGAAGILVRRFEHRPDWLRFGLPGEDGEWQRLRVALRWERGGPHQAPALPDS